MSFWLASQAKSKAGLRPALRDLSSAGLIFGRSQGLVVVQASNDGQEVAYRSLLSDRRRALHRAVAAELQRCSPEPNGGQASLIAYHWEEAGNTVQAIESTVKAAAWYGAGDVARRVEWDKVRDPGRALDAWKRVHRLLTGRSLKGAARQELLAACGQVLSFGRERHDLRRPQPILRRSVGNSAVAGPHAGDSIAERGLWARAGRQWFGEMTISLWQMTPLACSPHRNTPVSQSSK